MRVRGAVASAAGLVVLAALAWPLHASAQGELDANCPGPREFSLSITGNERWAQTFVPQVSGALVRAEIDITKFGGNDDFVVGVNAVDAAGVPTNTALASTIVPNATVPTGQSSLAASFPSPAIVTAGERYALVFARPGTTAFQFGARSGDDCPGSLYFNNMPTGGMFAISMPPNDLVFSTYVLESDPPETLLTASPKPKTKRRRATFEFTSDELGSTFECAVDGQLVKVACTSPFSVKVKRGKHTFQVQATDAAGNVDGTPATDDWKVRKRRK
jgi:hypothetical protein